jgi:serine/threonine protein kinase
LVKAEDKFGEFMAYTEISILKKLQAIEEATGYPKLHSCGKCGQSDYIIVFDYYEMSLSNYFRKMHKRLDYDYIIKIGLQLIKNIKILHDLGYSHSDLKPSNLMVNKGNSDIYIIDFGLAEKLNPDKRKRFVGTPYYSATNHL